MTRYANILETVGRTPVVRINKLAPEGVEDRGVPRPHGGQRAQSVPTALP